MYVSGWCEKPIASPPFDRGTWPEHPPSTPQSRSFRRSLTGGGGGGGQLNFSFTYCYKNNVHVVILPSSQRPPPTRRPAVNYRSRRELLIHRPHVRTDCRYTRTTTAISITSRRFRGVYTGDSIRPWLSRPQITRSPPHPVNGGAVTVGFTETSHSVRTCPEALDGSGTTECKIPGKVCRRRDKNILPRAASRVGLNVSTRVCTTANITM